MLTLSKIDAVKTLRPQERLQKYKIARNDPGYNSTINLLLNGCDCISYAIEPARLQQSTFSKPHIT